MTVHVKVKSIGIMRIFGIIGISGIFNWYWLADRKMGNRWYYLEYMEFRDIF